MQELNYETAVGDNIELTHRSCSSGGILLRNVEDEGKLEKNCASFAVCVGWAFMCRFSLRG
jgi:hypothetical protein